MMLRIASILSAHGESLWPQFRGPAGRSTSVGEYLAASPAIVDGKLYVCTREPVVAMGAR